MDKKRKDKLLDKSIRSQLNETENKELASFYKNQNQLNEEMNLRRDIHRGIEYLSDKEFKFMLDTIHHDLYNKKKWFTSKLLWLCTAFLVVIVISIFKFLDSNNKVLEPQQIFAEYYIPYKSYPGSRGSDNEILLNNFSNLYRQKNYDEALDVILPIVDKLDSEMTLLTGIAALESERDELAISLFDKIIQEKDIYFQDHALWYKALLYIKQKDYGNAKIILGQLSSKSDADHSKEAKALLQELE